MFNNKKFVSINEISIEELENEDQNIQLSLLDQIDRIVKIHSSMKKDCENIEKYQNFLDRYLTACSKILEINSIQTLLFSYILNEQKINIEKIASILQVSKIQCLKYQDDIDTLLNKRLICKPNRRGYLVENDGYWVPFEVITAVKEGKKFLPPRYHNLSKHTFFKHISDLFEAYFYDNISKEIFKMDFNNLFNDNTQLEFVKKINELSLEEENMIMLTYLCVVFNIRGINSFPLNKLMSEFNLPELDKYKLIDPDNSQLLKLKLIDCGGYEFKNNEVIVLTHKAITELLGITEHSFQRESDMGLINHKDIIQKKLFYNKSEEQKIHQLTELLLEKNYTKVLERLKAKGLRTGFNCLFYGAPGTGKTETVNQIARTTGRNIMSIDISETKSHWFGQSEQVIKGLFIQYQIEVKKATNENRPVPILVLNEADAIINKRKDTASSGVAQTENIIQNIILEEMEELDGIMIATTNLIENIDKAFERRFIYKINFLKPEVGVRQSIWKSIIPELTNEEVNELAKNFDLSGGQIENIARKRTIFEILNEENPVLTDLIDFCREEAMFRNDSNIGF